MEGDRPQGISVYPYHVAHFPLVGWLTGLWERRVYACDDPKKRRCRAKIFGSAMATLTGVFMFFLSGPLDMIATLSGKEIAAHVVLLMVFPLAGLILSIIGIRLKNSSASFIPSMSIVTVISIFMAAVFWFHLYILLSVFFFEF